MKCLKRIISIKKAFGHWKCRKQVVFDLESNSTHNHNNLLNCSINDIVEACNVSVSTHNILRYLGCLTAHLYEI